jgi:hypothetical protein
MQPVTVIITASEGADLDGVKREAEARGLTDAKVLTMLRVVLGAIARDRMEALRSVEGVGSVREERHFQLPPPGAPQ